MIASPDILTPKGELPLRVEFGGMRDDSAIRAWRESTKRQGRGRVAADAVEFACLAGKRWRYYKRRHEAAMSLHDLQQRIAEDATAEVGFLLVGRSSWKPAPAVLALAWCRRTWCNTHRARFLAAHPVALDSSAGYKGVGLAMLRSLSVVASRIHSPLIWGEATESSAPFYQKFLGEPGIRDHFFIREAALAALQSKLADSTS